MTAAIAPELDRIRRAFPELAFERAALIDQGEDHRVIVLDGAAVFRFPREADYLASFPAELSLLAALAPRSPLAVPLYQWIAPDRSFGGYRLIEGEPLTIARFGAMARTAQEALIASLAAFLAVLHRLSPEVLRRPDGAQSTDDHWRQDQSTDYSARRRARLARRIDAALLARLDRAHDILARLAPQARAVIHGDFTLPHILIAPRTDRAGGVIDFGDAALGDPAYDFTLFHALADWAPAFALQAYGGGDEGMLTRSALSFIRYAAARLSDSEAADGEHLAALWRTLGDLGL